jgi:osmoprotectant transport system ATP-binding protein
VQKQNQVSTLLVTHDLREAKRLAGYLLILDQGVVVQAGTPEDVLEHPATAYVERLIESQLA